MMTIVNGWTVTALLSIPALTAADQSSKDVWSNGDEVGIFMTTQTAEFANKKYVASDGGTLTAAPGQTLRYPEEGTASFIAYYPYSASLKR